MKEPVGLSIKPSERSTNINLSGNRGNHVEGNRIAGITASIHTRFCPLRMRPRSLRFGCRHANRSLGSRELPILFGLPGVLPAWPVGHVVG